MAGGGSIPFEALRAGASVVAAEYNPVGYVILKSTVEYPARFGASLAKEIVKWGEWINSKAREDLKELYLRTENEHVLAYIWARTVRCPSCNLIVPLSPNWWLSRRKGKKERIAVRLAIRSPKTTSRKKPSKGEWVISSMHSSPRRSRALRNGRRPFDCPPSRI
jgi:adenine-specific DNA methylase